MLTPYENDPDTGELHLAHAAWRALAWLETVLQAQEKGLCTIADLECGKIAVSELGPKIVAAEKLLMAALTQPVPDSAPEAVGFLAQGFEPENEPAVQWGRRPGKPLASLDAVIDETCRVLSEPENERTMPGYPLKKKAPKRRVKR